METKMKSGFRAILVAVIISIISGLPHKSVKTDEIDYRLPKAVIPKSYELSLETHVHSEGLTNFGGSVRIQLEILEESHEIKLHNRDLTLESIKLTDSNGSYLDIVTSNDDIRDFLIITPLDSLYKNQTYFLEIKFNGRLKTFSTSGFYRSKYQINGENQPRYLAVTQFEPTSAREAFPCFDEPEFKATFILTIIHGSNYHALSNTNGETEKIDNELSRTTFKETPKMPTYLLAFLISDLNYFSFPSSDSVKQRIYARPEYIEKNYAATGYIFSKDFLKQMEDKFSYKFDTTIGKLDSVAVPDHGSAMENWGLILYKEQYLILETSPHPYEMYDVAGTVAHEIAHQFFGNVVTCKWWDQIWLNEGFATWIEFQLPELFSITKSLRFYELFNIRKTHVALHSDSLQSTRPMTNPVSSPSEIGAQFDDIAYDKAGAVLRMFQYAIGDELFTKALNDYLTRFAHSSVTSDDLLSSIERVLPQPFSFDVKRAFKTWELNKGYPVINVSYNSDERKFYIRQKRYLSVYEDESKDDQNNWYIPLSYTTGANPDFNNTNFSDYFSDQIPEKIISTDHISNFNGNQWYIFNIHQLGYYRVNYDENNWKKIIDILNSENYQDIHVLNRAQLVDDALTFAFDGFISYDIAFRIVSYLKRETDYIPWYAASVAFDRLDYILKNTGAHRNFQTFVEILLQKLYSKYDFEKIDSLKNSEQLAVELAINWSCRNGNKRCMENAFNQMKMRNMSKPLESVYICNGMKSSDTSSEYEYLFNRMNNSIIQNERMRIIKGLVCSNDRDILNKFIHSPVVGNTYYRSHEIRKILGSVAEKSSIGFELLIGLIKDHYDDIISKTNEGYVDTLLIDMAKRISTKEDEQRINEVIDELITQGKVLNQSTKDAIQKHIKFNQQWVTSIMFNSASRALYELSNENFENALRLPKNARPKSYEISLDVRNVHKGELPYTGEVRINVEILERTDRLALHSKDHIIQELKIYNGITHDEISVFRFVQNPKTDILAIYLIDDLQPNQSISINIKFSAKLLTEIDGFYLDSYVEFDESNYPHTKYLATTQFQAVEARRAFPCFDEPEYRTEFDVKIRHDATYNAVSNMPVKDLLVSEDGTTQTIFETTPPMSSYLLAFLVSDFKYLSNNASDGETLQRIYTRPGKEQKAKYGLENSVKLLDELEKLTNMKFDLPKLDSGAIPGKGGGMENWGLILYREAALIYEDNDEDIAHDVKQRGVRLIAHEVAHMFFGNLVTAEWWNYLWLNEGFATYIMYYLTDKLYPEWKMKEFYSRNIMLPYAFPTDASDRTRSMSSELITVDEINDSFDDITYDKASCVIRMFHNMVGEHIFKEALNLYLKQNEYKVVTSQHLIDAFQQTLNEHSISYDFEHIFRTWEMQAGFPVISVQFKPQSSSFHLTQNRFFEKMNENVGDKSSWYIPINYVIASNANFEDTSITHYFKDGQEEYLIKDEFYDGNDWYIFNKQQIGYYRVNYDEKNWKALTEALNSDQYERIHILNRVQLIDDAFSLANAGYIELQIPYEIILYLRNETNFFAWDIASNHIFSLFSVFGTRNQELNLFMYHLSKRFYEIYKIKDLQIIPKEEMPLRYGRELAISIACAAGNEDCINDSILIGSKDVKNEQRIPPGLEDEILCIYFQQTDSADEFKEVFDRMNILYQPSQSSYKMNLINALACTKSSELLYEFLETSIGMHENNVNYTRSQKRAVFNAVLKNDNGMSAVFKLTNKFPGFEMVNSYGWSWPTILKNIAASVYSESEKDLFLEYMENMNHTGLTREDIEEAKYAADQNLMEQSMPSNSKQMRIIIELLEREFLEPTPPPTVSTTTTTSPPTVSTTTTTKPTSPPTVSTTTTTKPPTTTPSNATSMTLNILLLTLTIFFGLLRNNLFFV